MLVLQATYKRWGKKAWERGYNRPCLHLAAVNLHCYTPGRGKIIVLVIAEQEVRQLIVQCGGRIVLLHIVMQLLWPRTHTHAYTTLTM